MKLAIEGHSTQGSEVIARLKMLGGMNTFNLNGSETNCYYYIDNNNRIYHCLGIDPRNYIYYTLEEFLEKFPYKVGDKVQYKGATSCGSIFEVEEMRWEENTIKYTLCLFGCNYKRSTLPAEYLQPYKEETMEEGDKAKAPNLVGEDYSGKRFGYKIPNGYEFDCIKNNEIIIKPIKPKYPKTYDECCKVLGYNDRETYRVYHTRASEVMFETLYRLKVCRDAYWKIAGEEMGLDKPWKPDYDSGVNKYGIICMNGVVQESNPTTNWERHLNKILDFPTKEMRDAFYNNFKDLIEQCKELL